MMHVRFRLLERGSHLPQHLYSSDRTTYRLGSKVEKKMPALYRT